MPELETDEPDLPGGTVQSFTRADSLREINEMLANHAHISIDGHEFDVAGLVVAAAELIQQAVSKLEEWGTADDNYEEATRARTRAGGTDADSDQATG